MGDVPASESSERPDTPRDNAQQTEVGSGLERPQCVMYPTTNGTAIVALVATLVPFPLAGGILGIVLGIFGLREIHRSGQTGAPVAVAAIIFGSVVVATWLLFPILLIEFGVRLFGTRL